MHTVGPDAALVYAKFLITRLDCPAWWWDSCWAAAIVTTISGDSSACLHARPLSELYASSPPPIPRVPTFALMLWCTPALPSIMTHTCSAVYNDAHLLCFISQDHLTVRLVAASSYLAPSFCLHSWIPRCSPWTPSTHASLHRCSVISLFFFFFLMTKSLIFSLASSVTPCIHLFGLLLLQLHKPTRDSTICFSHSQKSNWTIKVLEILSFVSVWSVQTSHSVLPSRPGFSTDNCWLWRDCRAESLLCDTDISQTKTSKWATRVQEAIKYLQSPN